MTGPVVPADSSEDSGFAPSDGALVARAGSQASFAAVLGNGPFLRLWLAQAISQTANSMVDFALLLRVSGVVEYHNVPQANTAISLVILAFSLPGVIFGPFAGAVADRVDRKLLMAVVNLFRAGAVFLFLLIQPDWNVQAILAAYYAITFLFGTAGQFFAPAQGAMIPELVPRNHLVPANALFNLTFTAAQLLGFTVLGPVAAKILGVDLLFFVTAVFFFGCAVLTMTLPKAKPRVVLPTVGDAGPFVRLLADVREGLIFILNDPLLMRAIAYLTIASTSFLLVAALGPAFVTQVIGLSEEDIGLIVAPAGVGVVAGVLLVPRLVRRFPRESVIDWAMAGAGIVLLGLSLSRVLLGLLFGEVPSTVETIFAGSLAAVLGAFNACVLVPAQTILQERSHEHIRARVYATFYTISNTVAFIPIFFAAAAADLFGVVQVMSIVAIVLVIVGVKSMARRRSEEAARWARVRTRHRQGPEAFEPRR
ncbi:MAG TPA: MFS transporter [Thermomicrobiales bacterium]|nr:MFS transporter [Thermomicrobiales bacterium]